MIREAAGHPGAVLLGSWGDLGFRFWVPDRSVLGNPEEFHFGGWGEGMIEIRGGMPVLCCVIVPNACVFAVGWSEGGIVPDRSLEGYLWGYFWGGR